MAVPLFDPQVALAAVAADVQLEQLGKEDKLEICRLSPLASISNIGKEGGVTVVPVPKLVQEITFCVQPGGLSQILKKQELQS